MHSRLSSSKQLSDLRALLQGGRYILFHGPFLVRAWMVVVLVGLVCVLGSAERTRGQDPLPNPFELSPQIGVRAGESAGPEDAIRSEQGKASELASAVDDKSVDPKDALVEQDEVAQPDTPPAGDANADGAEGANVAGVGDENEAADENAQRGANIGVDLQGANDGDAVLKRAYAKTAIIEIDGPIFGQFNWYLNNRLDWAQGQGAELVILVLTSPGGDLEYSLALARRLSGIDWAKTIVFIREEAISGGAIISLGADRILMQRGALVGDAGPIQLDKGGQFEFAEEKIISYLGEAIAELARQKSRPGTLARAMVDRNLKVVEARDRKSGERVYISAYDARSKAEQYEVVGDIPETGQNRFLTVSAVRALELELCEGVYANEAEFLKSMQLGDVVRTNMTGVDKVVYILNRPFVTGLLLIVGLIGLYFEVAAPGISVAGLVSLLSFSVFFWSHVLGGTAGWLDVLLFVLGIVCVLIELFVLPGFGVFGITGIGLLVAALVMASQTFVVPESTADWTMLRTNLIVVLGAMAGVLLLGAGQLLLFDSLPGLRLFQLQAPAPDPANAKDFTTLTTMAQATSGGSQLASAPATVGDRGFAESDLRPAGKVRIGDGLIDVISEGDYVEAGSSVRVLRVEGNHIIVRKELTS